MKTLRMIAKELKVNRNTLVKRLLAEGIKPTKIQTTAQYVRNLYDPAAVKKIKALLKTKPIGKRGRPLKALKKKKGRNHGR